jgi:hypothetical protein
MLITPAIEEVPLRCIPLMTIAVFNSFMQLTAF